MNPFHSARLKLTAFYFAILVVFCVLLTFGVRAFTDHELRRGDDAQRGAFHRLVVNLYDPGPQWQPPSDRSFASAQRAEADRTRQNLNRDFLLLDIGMLAVGAGISYWYAGRTLRPIEEAHEKQKRFTADASHELRTPLTNMRVENEVFLRQKKISEAEARSQIASNLEEVDRLERLASSLLALSRYEGAELVRTKLSVKKLADEAIAGVQRNVAAKGITFENKLEDAMVLGEHESLVRLFGIVLENAVKYGPKDGTVQLSGAKQGGEYTVHIQDRGPGIAAEDLPHIFERMYRGDKARSSRVAGHGIGLGLAAEIATANGARLEATNHTAGGAQFSIALASAK
jgi:two-component system sensor histidine kinase CiaH